MCLKIVGKFPRGLNDHQDGLFQREVTDFSLMQRFAHEIDRPLYAVVHSDQHQAHCVRGHGDVGE